MFSRLTVHVARFPSFKGCIKFHYMSYTLPAACYHVCWPFTFLPPLTSVNAVMNSAVQIFLWDAALNSFEVALLSDIILFCNVFKKQALYEKTFSIMAAPFYIPYLHSQSPNLSVSLLTLDIFCSFDNGPSKGMRWLAYICGLVEFLLWSVMLTIFFISFLAICLSWENCFYKVYCPFLIGSSSHYWVVWFPFIFGYLKLFL